MNTVRTECLTGGEAVVCSLERHGVRHVFGIPGDQTIPIYEALQSSSIHHLATRHEQGAGFMADGYARASGLPGVAIVIGGPGVTNIATAMGEAYADGVPLLVISAEISSSDIGAGRDHNHEMKDQLAAASAICASSERVTRVSRIPEAIDRAFRSFHAGRPRSVHIGIPVDVLEAREPVSFAPRGVFAPTAPDPLLIGHAAQLLRAADMPIVLLGGGARGARTAALALAEALGAPVMTTLSGKDAFSNDHPLYVGGGFHLGMAINADVVLAVGTQLGRTDFWNAPVSVNGSVVRVDIDPEQIDANVPATVGLVGDARVIIEALTEVVGIVDRPAATERAANLRSKIDAEADTVGLRYKPWLFAVRAALPADAIVAMDSTLLSYRGYCYMGIPAGGAWLYPNAYGTLGYALPAAIGARVAQPDRAAVVLIGDGGLLFTCSELLTATECGFGLPVIVWNDHGFGTIRQGMQKRGIKPLGVDYSIPDMAALAHAFGGEYASPQTTAALETAVRDALARRLPTIIDIDDRLAA